MTETSQEKERIEELRRKHSELWNELSVMPEDEAALYLDSFSSQIKREDVENCTVQKLNLNDAVRSPWFYICLVLGVCVPILLYVAFIYISLTLE